MKRYARVMPAVNQIELHPRYSSPALREVARRMGCLLVGYGTGNSVKIEGTRAHRASGEVKAALASTPALRSTTQVVLAWTLAHGVGVIPRSGDEGHIRQNLDVLTAPGGAALGEGAMAALDALNENYPYYWSPLPNNDLLEQQDSA